MSREILHAKDEHHPNFYVIGVYDPDRRQIDEYVVYHNYIFQAIEYTASKLGIDYRRIVSAQLF